MRLWDLTGGAAKLELALKTLQTKTADIGEAWSDEAYARFLETYLEPIEPRMKTMIDAIHRAVRGARTRPNGSVATKNSHEAAELMTEPFSPDGPQQILTDLCRLAAERVPAEEAIAAGFQARNEAAEKAYQEAQEALTARYQAEKAAAEAEDAALRKEADRALRERTRRRAAAI